MGNDFISILFQEIAGEVETPELPFEEAFQSWYGGWAEETGISPNPDDPRHKYNYRAAFMEGAEPSLSPEDGSYHWPSKYKTEDHPNRYVDGVDTITGKKK